MFSRFILWIKNNKLAVLLFFVVLYLFFNPTVWTSRGNFDTTSSYSYSDTQMQVAPMVGNYEMGKMGYVGGYGGVAMDTMGRPESVSPVSGARLISREVSLSLLVKNVKDTIDEIASQAEGVGGFLVSSDMSSPGENASGSVVVRVPSSRLQQVVTSYRALGLRVVSEQINGTDITDQYTDIQARLRPLQETYEELDKLRAQSGKIEEKMSLLMQLQNIQSQIDSLKGQEKYLKDSADTSRISVYVSTDEFELPYTPNDNWRAKVVFKQAVRDMVISLRGLTSKGIYFIVYAVIWIPALIVGYLIWKWLVKKANQSPPPARRV